MLSDNGATLLATLPKKSNFACLLCKFTFSLLIDDFDDVINDLACKCNS